MGAEVVIAVDISTPLDSIEEIRTFFNVTGQMTGFQTRKNVLEQIETLGPRDILIVPPLEGIKSGSFEPREARGGGRLRRGGRAGEGVRRSSR